MERMIAVRTELESILVEQALWPAPLRSGRSIGSGGVESLARRMGRRLKVPGRGWCVENLEGMAALIATVDTPEWDDLWTRPAA